MRILFNVATEMQRKVKLYHIKTSFLHSNLSEEIYMELSQECDNKKGEIYKLNKNMCRLHQAGRC